MLEEGILVYKQVQKTSIEYIPDDCGLHRNITFIYAITFVQIGRHLPGIMDMIQQKLPKVDLSNVGVSVDLQKARPTIDVFDASQVKVGTNVNGFEVDFNLKMTLSRLSRTVERGESAFCAHVLVKEGRKTAVSTMKIYLEVDKYCIPPLSIVRPSSIAFSKGKPLECRVDEMEQIIRSFKLRRAGEWYAPGKGSVARLYLDIDKAAKEYRRLEGIQQQTGDLLMLT